MGGFIGKLFLGHEPNVTSMTEKVLASDEFKAAVSATPAQATPPQKVTWDDVFDNSCTQAADGSCTFNWNGQWNIHRDADGKVSIRDIRTGRMQIGEFGLLASEDGKLHIYSGNETSGKFGTLSPDGSYVIG